MPNLQLLRSPGDGQLVLQASGTPGAAYALETRESGGAWTRIENLTLDAQGSRSMILGQPATSVRFYRLVSAP